MSGSISMHIMATLYILAGLNHFRAPKFYQPMMPPWIPKPDLMIALSGVAEILLGTLLFFSQTRSLAAWGIILMLIAFFPVHIFMYQARKEKFKHIPVPVLVGRFFLQFALIYWAYLYTG